MLKNLEKFKLRYVNIKLLKGVARNFGKLWMVEKRNIAA